MEERTCKTIKRSLIFEKSGETLSVEVSLENVSPDTEKESLSNFLDSLYENVKMLFFSR